VITPDEVAGHAVCTPTPGGIMLEVNDFNAIRISLASPEQIRGWSYGEVTKP